MKIVDVILSEGKTGFYFDDQRAIKKGAKLDKFLYDGEIITEGFKTIRQAGESISVMIILEDGQIAHGDCAAVQYSGAGGRDPLFLAEDFIPYIKKHIIPLLVGEELTSFRELASIVDSAIVDEKRIHTAIRYGVTQALLDAVAKSKKITMAEVIHEEYELTNEIKAVPIFGQSGDDRYANVDKMIIKETSVMPHALINNIESKLGQNGELLLEYITWLRNRILTKRVREDYYPVLHIDVYGTIGMIFDCDMIKMADYIETLAEAASPLKLRIEGPMDVEDRALQINSLSELTKEIDDRNINVELVADEWCNTLEDIKLFADHKAGHMVQIKTPDLGGVNNIAEAIIYCKERNIGAYSGGTCNETNRSAEVSTNIALACGADQMLAKPGMGFDEGYMIVFNEMNRVLTQIAYRNSK
ncbi:methylaspartate ammonia-lyase [Haloplasma contractile]|uniref:methylaspartate ammonia-lyase n=1 Tax=Haloplasma contractile SSD-17B TaxID=1033810 RepID=U2EGW8_9MOLU|nr:methylaspartate ammonia-lyase [Haloplasma contractile]ERJ13851.1 methylaspartate ammonia-lyase protein [Haloplasma contractile SSD-17B]